jgi:predicted lipoprotein
VQKPDYKVRSQITRGATISALCIGLVACGESTSSTQGSQFGQGSSNPTDPDDTFNQTLLLQNLTDNVILPTYSNFVGYATEQNNAITNYCQGLQTQLSDVAGLKAQAQQNWRTAMDGWQVAEVMQIGPLLDNSSSLRNKIYSWPNVSACAIDQDVVLAEQSGYDISSRTVSRKGLDALEYLLFSQNLDHSCTVFGTEPEGWNNRTEQDRQLARCEFAEIVAAEIVADGQQLVDAWQGDGAQSGYADILKNAGQPDSIFLDVHDAVNDVTDALFYIDTLTKDAKLATPLGLFANDCGLEPCVENVESRFAFNSLANVISNIEGLNLIFLGGETTQAIGFDDYLIDVGDQDTADQMRSDLANVIQFAKSLQMSLSQLLEQDPDQVQQVHDQLKDVTDNMKSDFIQSLALELPATSAGDND